MICHLMNKELKSKLYHKKSLTLARLLDIVSDYHQKEAFILASEEKVNCTSENHGKALSSQICNS